MMSNKQQDRDELSIKIEKLEKENRELRKENESLYRYILRSCIE